VRPAMDAFPSYNDDGRFIRHVGIKPSLKAQKCYAATATGALFLSLIYISAS
jgi:hypothetical protein